ncbi:MAG: hypothetical protein ACT4NU_13200 [Chromatiales bacterium]
MKEQYTHISVILDRTGSMESIRDDTIGGFNTFLDEQKKQPGTATLTLVQFDTQDPYEVIHSFKPIQEVSPLSRETYIPRASTPLLDAMGRGINDLEEQISDLPEEVRPSKVVVVVITDGQENSSREFHRDQVVKMIREKTERTNWQFVFLGADLNAIGDAISLGIPAHAVLPFERTGAGTAAAWASLSARTSEYRTARRKKIEFESNDRKHPNDPNKHE